MKFHTIGPLEEILLTPMLSVGVIQ